ncbi:hypothetical protein Vi05172_g8420 [Venturia inaequalis]|nr:hypothetical protein Vi05172_g8420 [Venturia inaequalis]
MSTATTTMPGYHEDQLNGSGLLTNSTSSLSNSRHQTSHIAKTYRQAAQLFLTRRLPEALSTIQPVIIPEPVKDGNQNAQTPVAPIATASRGTRIKVWSFYLTFINAVVELGAEEGKHAFGSTRWKQLVNKARDGTIWEDIVRDGYAGNEGSVDADVVINLATLLLTHSPSQKLNQQRLETYLSAMSNPTFDITSHLNSTRLRRNPSSASGTNTPRDLHTSLKLLELYTLHVLPRNQEWEYARDFIMMSEVLDEERKEAFLQALHGLKEEQEQAKTREKELQKQQQIQLEQQRREEEKRRIEEERKREEEILRREEARRTQRPPDSGTGSSNMKPKPTPTHGKPDSLGSPSSKRKKEVTRRPPPASLYNRATSFFAAFQTMIQQTAESLSQNPMAMMRAVLFLLIFALAFGRRDLRERVKRMIQRAWEKVRGTVGMGVKVSYI